MDIGNAASLIQQSVAQNNAWSAQQAQNQMDFQREMSNTAFQRQVADLKAAGLNPVLAARLGGASTPSGAMGSTDTSGTSALVNLLEMAMETANSAAGAAHAAVGGRSVESAADESIAYRLLGAIDSASSNEWQQKVLKQEDAMRNLANKLQVDKPKTAIDYTRNGLAELIRFSADLGKESREKGVVPPAGTSARKAYNRFNDIKEPQSKSNFQKWQDANRSAILANMYRLRADAGRSKGNGGR